MESTTCERLAGRVAIVTGAADGIGEGIARRFAAEGCRVVLADIDGERLSRVASEIGHRARAFPAEVSLHADVDALVRHALEQFGRVDILVNNAAAYRGDGPLMSVAENVWDRIMAVNVKAPWLCTRAVVPAMRAVGGGAIVNIGSVNGSFGLSLAAYSASKGGLAALTRLAAIELGPDKIRVNTIEPGTIQTRNSRALYAERPGLKETVAAMYPMGELGDVADVASAALYLASPESKFVNGSILTVDGGLTAGRAFGLDAVDD